MNKIFKPIFITLTVLMLVPVFGSSAFAGQGSAAIDAEHHAQNSAVRKRRARMKRAAKARAIQRSRRARIARRNRARLARRNRSSRHITRTRHVHVTHRPRVIVQESAPVVVRTSPTLVTEEPQIWDDASKLGVGVRMNSIMLEGEKLNLSNLENPTMYGPGVTFTGHISPQWDLELAVDLLQGQEDDFSQRSIPVTLSGIYKLFPDSPVTPYGVVGGGVNFTQLSYGSDAFVHDITELNGHAGGGVKIRLSDDVALSADVRANMQYKNLGSTTTIRSECIASGACGGLGNVSPADKLNVGMTAQAGAIFYF
jgi:hypothetical protein